MFTERSKDLTHWLHINLFFAFLSPRNHSNHQATAACRFCFHYFSGRLCSKAALDKMCGISQHSAGLRKPHASVPSFRLAFSCPLVVRPQHRSLVTQESLFIENKLHLCPQSAKYETMQSMKLIREEKKKGEEPQRSVNSSVTKKWENFTVLSYCFNSVC